MGWKVASINFCRNKCDGFIFRKTWSFEIHYHRENGQHIGPVEVNWEEPSRSVDSSLDDEPDFLNFNATSRENGGQVQNGPIKDKYLKTILFVDKSYYEFYGRN